MRKYKAYSSTLIVLLIIFISVVCHGVTTVVNQLAEKQNVQRFKDLYSAYTGALMLTVEEMSGETGCYYTQEKNVPPNFSGCDNFYKTFVSNLHLEKYCQENALKGGCIPQYEDYSSNPVCKGFSENMVNNYDDAFVMKDGSNLIVYNEAKNTRRPIFAIDANGLSKPNKAGEDLFSMTIIRNLNGSYYFHSNITHCLAVKPGGIHYLSDVFK